MAGDVVNIKVCGPLKLRSGLLASLREAPFGRLTGNYHAICQYSYNLLLGKIAKMILQINIYYDRNRKADNINKF
jgi:hypothetical protein